MMRKLQLRELNRLTPSQFEKVAKRPIICILDNIRSGMNVGSVFRTADSFAIDSIFLCGITAQPPHREILKTAIGADEAVDWTYFENTQSAVEYAVERGFKVVPIEQTNKSVLLNEYPFQSEDKLAFIFGNEVKGVSDQVITQFDESIEIPQYGTKHSLNVSVSVGIVLWHAVQKMGLI